jgi:hypothetical protein
MKWNREKLTEGSLKDLKWFCTKPSLYSHSKPYLSPSIFYHFCLAIIYWVCISVQDNLLRYWQNPFGPKYNSDYDKYLFRALKILAKSTFSRKVNLVETENYLGPVTYLSENLLLRSYLTNIIFFNSARI